MAITPGRASNASTQTVGTDWTDLLSTGGTGFLGCEDLLVVHLPTSAAETLHVAAQNKAATGDTIHRITSGTPSDFFELARGESIVLSGSLDNKIIRAMAKAASGTASLKWTVLRP